MCGLWSLLGAQEPLTNCSGERQTRGPPSPCPWKACLSCPYPPTCPHLLLLLLQLPHSAHGGWALFTFFKTQSSRLEDSRTL